MKWYDSLNKSKLTPPPYIFSIVWPILYFSIFLSLFFYVSSPDYTSLGLFYFIIQFILNILWPIVFFKFHNITLALFILIFLCLFIFMTLFEFSKTNSTSSLLLLPYFIWSLFALYLNLFIFINNPRVPTRNHHGL
jgi:tryptophan-rich sensory protein